MVIGVGIDLIEVERVRKACERAPFLRGTYTEEEQRLIASHPQRAAGNFAAKEAVAKALGTGFYGFRPPDIEVLRKESGEPYVVLHGGALALAKSKRIGAWHLSITHTKTEAAAIAVAEMIEGKGFDETDTDGPADEGL